MSVDHPDVVQNYRSAHAIQQSAQAQQTSTEDLRLSLRRYRSILERPLAA
ncbi:MAG: hypothetical protein ACLQDY_17080 [Streptosporangiaceae bacterium]